MHENRNTKTYVVPPLLYSSGSYTTISSIVSAQLSSELNNVTFLMYLVFSLSTKEEKSVQWSALFWEGFRSNSSSALDG